MNTENSALSVIAPAERAALALKSAAVETELRSLAASSADIVAVIDPAGREQAHRIAMTLRGRRVDITKIGKDARADATKFSNAVISEEARLIAIIEPEETRVLGLRNGYDAEQERIEAEKLAKERARMEAHEAALAEIFRIPAKMANASSSEIMAERYRCANHIASEAWQEYRQKAAAAHAEVTDQLQAMYKAKLDVEEAARAEAEAREVERKRVAAEVEALARQKAEQQAESERLTVLATELEAKAAAERERVATEIKRQIEAQQAALAETRRAQDEADKRAYAHAQEIKRQSDELAAEREKYEAMKLADQRAAQQAKEAATKMEEDHAEVLEINAAWFVPAVDTRPVITVELDPAPELPPMDQEVPPTLRLGQITERLGFGVTAALLSSLGFEPSGKDKAAVLFHEHQFGPICDALNARINVAKMAWAVA